MTLSASLIIEPTTKIESSIAYGPTSRQSSIHIGEISIIFSPGSLGGTEEEIAAAARQIAKEANKVARQYESLAEKESGRIRTLTEA